MVLFLRIDLALLIVFCLNTKHIGILSVLFHQRVVCSAFFDDSALKQYDTVTEAGACETVGNIDRGLPFCQISVLQIELIFGNWVKGCGR